MSEYTDITRCNSDIKLQETVIPNTVYSKKSYDDNYGQQDDGRVTTDHNISLLSTSTTNDGKQYSSYPLLV
jgi:hypothetical protein